MDPNNFGELPWRAVRLFPDRTAIEQGDAAVTFAELEQRIQRTAALLHSLGVGRGERVLLLFPNDYRYTECLLGPLRLGAVSVPLNIKLGDDVFTYIANHSEATVLLAHAELADKAAALAKAAPQLRHRLLVGGESDGFLAYDKLHAEAAPTFATVPVELDDVALMMYTSGSTGRPKGVQLSHRNKWWQARSSVRTMFLTDRDKALVTGPLYHANALWACMLPMLYAGGGQAVLPHFEPVMVLEAIDRYRPTFLSGTPSMYSLLLAQRDVLARVDTSSVTMLMCGSAPVPAELMRQLKEQFPNCEIVETYGLTEAGANILSPRWGLKKLGSCGIPVPGVEIRIVDPADETRLCAPGEVGELWSRSDANALGYYKQPEQTAVTFTADGWMKTGDLVRQDEDGYVYFCGRKDDMINCGGENLYPKEIETVLLTHPDIDDVCVVPAPHKLKGEAPVAWVVPREPGCLTEEDVRRYFLQRGPAYAHPRRVFFVDALPVSGTNKLDRKYLVAETRRLLPDGLSGSDRLE